MEEFYKAIQDMTIGEFPFKLTKFHYAAFPVDTYNHYSSFLNSAPKFEKMFGASAFRGVVMGKITLR